MTVKKYRHTLRLLTVLVLPLLLFRVCAVPAFAEATTAPVSEIDLLVGELPDQDHVFRSYWAAYFRCLFRFLTHPGEMTGIVLCGVVSAIVLILLVPVMYGLFVSYLFDRADSEDAVWADSGLPVSSWTGPGEVFSGCSGFLRKLLICIVVFSPCIADGLILYAYFEKGLITCIVMPVLLLVLRLLLGIASFFIIAFVLDFGLGYLIGTVHYVCQLLFSKQHPSRSLKSLSIHYSNNKVLCYASIIFGMLAALIMQFIPVMMDLV